jgi:hypothetical protein
MAIKKLEDFLHDIDVAKEVLSSMPVNNAKNLAAYKKKVAEYQEEYGEYRNELFNEVKKRSTPYLNYKPSDRTALVKKELENYKDLALFNPVNTPFEKMGFDTLLYSLTHYYKNDLESVNRDIKEVLAKFETVGISLTENDFVYSNYARRYIKELLADDNLERMKDIFEDLHWKCPDVILHVEISFRILFDKNVKVFEKYIEDKKKEIIMDNLSYDDYVIRRDNLAKELYELENFDTAVIIQKFMDGELMMGEYSVVNVGKAYNRFLGDNIEMSKAREKSEDLKTLLYNLEEYKDYMKYSYIIDDVKAKYAERTSHLGESSKINKEINTLISDLEKLTNSINSGSKGGLFSLFKKKVDTDDMYLQVNNKIKELETKYEEYDNAIVYDKLNQYINDSSSLYDVLSFALGYKGYLRTCIKSLDEEIDINVIKETVKNFERFLNNPNVTVLKNIPFTSETNVGEVVVDHHKLLNINISEAELTTVEDVEAMINSLRVIINDYYLNNAGLNIDFISNLFEAKKILETYN